MACYGGLQGIRPGLTKSTDHPSRTMGVEEVRVPGLVWFFRYGTEPRSAFTWTPRACNRIAFWAIFGWLWAVI